MRKEIFGKNDFPLAILVWCLLGFQYPTGATHLWRKNKGSCQTPFLAAQSTGRSRSEGRAEKNTFIKLNSADRMLAGRFSTFWNLQLHKPTCAAWVAPGSCSTGEDLACGRQNVRSSVNKHSGIIALYVDIQALHCWNTVTILHLGFKINAYLTLVWCVT